MASRTFGNYVICHHWPRESLQPRAVFEFSVYSIRSRPPIAIKQVCKYTIRKGLEAEVGIGLAKRMRNYSTMTSSICSITSSIQTSISSRSSAFPSNLWRRSSPSSFLRRARHAFHSSTNLLRRAMSSALTLLSSAASSSSNARLYSLRFLRICFCLSLDNRVGGRGRQMNCLKRS